MTLEPPAGQEVATDGGREADLLVRADPARPGEYDVFAGADHDALTLVAAHARGAAAVDLDQLGVAHARFVRVENRGAATVYLDALGAYRTAPAAVAPTALHAHSPRGERAPASGFESGLRGGRAGLVPNAAPVPRPADGFLAPPSPRGDDRGDDDTGPVPPVLREQPSPGRPRPGYGWPGGRGGPYWP
jgi:hypothetical protein